MTSVDVDEKGKENTRGGGHFSALLKIQGKLALREPSGVMGIAVAVGLLAV